MGRSRKQTVRRQWIAVGVLLVLCAAGLWVILRRGRPTPPGLRGPFPTRRLSYRPRVFVPQQAPGHLRLLRSRLPYHPGCAAQYRGRCVQRLALEEYVRGVVLAEEGIFRREYRHRRRHARALQAAWRIQAIAARTYALYAVLADKHRVERTGFHLTDTQWDQVYTDRRVAAVDRAVRATRGQVLVDRRGRLIYAEYSASCGGKGTRDVVRRKQHIPCHPRCARHRYRRSSHHRGLCQWGSFLHALDGRGLAWLRRRYFPNARLARIHTD